MSKEEFDGQIDGKKVKTIVKTNDKGETMYFAKPKNMDTVTPDFRKYGGTMSVHQDSPDGNFYRLMENIAFIGSTFYPQALTFAQSQGMDLAVLPMKKTANGYVIDTSASGATIQLPAPDWCLVAIGKWGEWKPKNC
jgi:hypothetical protein